MRKSAPELQELRTRLSNGQGKEFWRSLDELAETPEFVQYLHREFPENASEWHDNLGRRNFLKLMGASLALAGLQGCTSYDREKVVPYVKPPEEVVPGKPLFFATAMTLGGYARGLLVESHMGRPTKIEGNPEHPDTLGKTDTYGQAHVLGLYDPDRSKTVKFKPSREAPQRVSTWTEFFSELERIIFGPTGKAGERSLRILTPTVTSPTLARQLKKVVAEFPNARWHQWEPINRSNERAGLLQAFEQDVEPLYEFGKAKRILSLDADFLGAGVGQIRNARGFAESRRVRHDKAEMNRLYVAEGVPTATGAMADHRLSLRSSEVFALTKRIAALLGVGEAPALEDTAREEWAQAVAEDLKEHGSESVVLAGYHQPAAVHALAHAINAALGAAGTAVRYIEPVAAESIDQDESLRALAEEMNAGDVDVLILLGGNPVYTAPTDLRFAEGLGRVPFSAHVSQEDDETSAHCRWHLNEAHQLEAWSDARSNDGTATIIQPLIEPMYEGHSWHEVLATLLQETVRTPYDIVRDTWRERFPLGEFEQGWRRAVHDGFVPDTRGAELAVAVAGDFPGNLEAPAAVEGIEVLFRPDASVYDGRFANNGWLQELPDPITKLTWDNAALMSPALAERERLRNGDVAVIKLGDRTLRAPVWIVPGHPDHAVTLPLGYGRSVVGRVGQGAGFNAYRLRTSAAPWIAGGIEIGKTRERTKLATVQDHQSMEGRDLVRLGTLEEYEHDPHHIAEGAHHPPAAKVNGRELPKKLYPDRDFSGWEGAAWAMAIDLNVCIGCNGCTAACQAENNIPVVGKEEVLRAREMHWIRVDRYFHGSLDDPEIYHQPVPCMHCENAPCEVVCPVAATTHSEEGLNEMTYNRCVGTRYCSNNCPYKVRRFNFLHYTKDHVESPIDLLMNPDVTVRTRGVMEKCTYCVQRINSARIDAKKEDRPIRDGEVVTACQAACPTSAIVFGDKNDPESEIAKARSEPLNYGILTELNTEPRTTYLARLRNPNPRLEKPATEEVSAHG